MARPRKADTAINDALEGSYVGIAIAYAKEAVLDDKRKKFNRYIRFAAKRFIKDYADAHSPVNKRGFVFSSWHANDVCDFIEKLPHVEGNWGQPNIKLVPAQIFFLVNLFGFRNLAGGRRFTNALFCVSRKNAKSTLAAGILLYVYCCEDENGPQLLSAATTGDQARIVWGIARKMVEKCPPLAEWFGLKTYANAITREGVFGTFKPINAKASTQDGLNPSALSFDEVHAHKTRDLYDVLRSAAGARDNPLFLYTTTEGYINPGPWDEIRTYCEQLLSGLFEADHFLAVIYGLDKEDGDFDETKWIKANPLLGVSINLEKLQEYASEAKRLPGSLAEFRIKRLNRKAASGESWINLIKWDECKGVVDLEFLKNYPCFGGLDLASTSDMNAWRLIWYVEGKIYTWGRYWVPEEAVSQQTERGTPIYAAWIQGGWIEQTEGNVTDYRTIHQRIREDCERFDVREIGYDRWNSSQLVNELVEEEFPMVEFIQGPRSFNPPMNEFERAYIGGNFVHDGNPVLTWNANNIVARKDINMNKAPDKKNSAGKIDGIVSMLMGIGRLLDNEDLGPSVYEERGILELEV